MHNYNEFNERKEKKPSSSELVTRLPGIIEYYRAHPEWRAGITHPLVEIGSYEEMVREFFSIEDVCDEMKWKWDGESIEVLHALITRMNLFLNDWRKQRKRLDRGEITRNDYEHWRLIKWYGR